MNKAQNPAGFSFIEVCIMVGMLSVLAALAIPSLNSSMRGMQLISDAQNISSALTTAKLSATAQMTPYRISINTSNNEWRLEKFDRTANDFETKEINQLSSGISGSGISLRTSSSSSVPGFPSLTSTAITFNSRGIPIDAAGVPTASNIIYVSKSDMDLAISVSLSGKVEVWRNNDGRWCSQ